MSSDESFVSESHVVLKGIIKEASKHYIEASGQFDMVGNGFMCSVFLSKILV